MKKYDFLFKPVFFICCLIFATWMVLKIEQLQPSDFSRFTRLFEPAEKNKMKPGPDMAVKKSDLKQLCLDYKNGKIDSLLLDKRLSELLSNAR